MLCTFFLDNLEVVGGGGEAEAGKGRKALRGHAAEVHRRPRPALPIPPRLTRRWGSDERVLTLIVTVRVANGRGV
jgi:hypothetical protein